MKEEEKRNVISSKVLNIQGEVVSEIVLSDYIFGECENKTLLSECYEYCVNKKRGLTTAATKCRSDLTYSNRKLRQQKRTGRARVGRKGAPHHIHGAVAHGPDGSNYAYKMPKRKLLTGLRVLLSAKMRRNEIIIIDNLSFSEIKTKLFNNFMKVCNFTKAVLVSNNIDSNIYKSGRNIIGIDFLEAKAMNVLSLIKNQKLILSLNAIDFLNTKYGEIHEDQN